MDAGIQKALGDKADYYLGFKSPKIAKERLHLPGPDFVDRVFAASDRNNRVLASLQRLLGSGRLAGTTIYLELRVPSQLTRRYLGFTLRMLGGSGDAIRIHGHLL